MAFPGSFAAADKQCENIFGGAKNEILPLNERFYAAWYACHS
jgi:hypothetical protein